MDDGYGNTKISIHCVGTFTGTEHQMDAALWNLHDTSTDNLNLSGVHDIADTAQIMY